MTISFHTGAADTMAKVRLLEKEKLQPGETTWAQLVLVKPISMVKGERFIIRSPKETLGGGKVVETHARRLSRFRLATIENLKAQEEGKIETILSALLEFKQPLGLLDLLLQSQLPDGEVRAAIDSLGSQGHVIILGKEDHRFLFLASGWVRLVRETTALLKDYHQKYPLRVSVPKAELASRLKLGKYAAEIWQKLMADRVLSEEGLGVRLPTHKATLTSTQQSKIDAFLKSLAQSPYSPPGNQIPEPDLLNMLVEQQKVVKVSEGVIFTTAAYEEMVAKISAYIKTRGKVPLAEVRDLLNTSRKYAQALLEYLDEKKITRRVGDERVLY
tara:strand:- start:615 stop:1604 length:990 start_codon:yes stop_codon:yes gene_type:complete